MEKKYDDKVNKEKYHIVLSFRISDETAKFIDECVSEMNSENNLIRYDRSKCVRVLIDEARRKRNG